MVEVRLAAEVGSAAGRWGTRVGAPYPRHAHTRYAILTIDTCDVCAHIVRIGTGWTGPIGRLAGQGQDQTMTNNHPNRSASSILQSLHGQYPVNRLNARQLCAVFDELSDQLAREYMMHSSDEAGDFTKVKLGAVQDLKYTHLFTEEQTLSQWLHTTARRMGMNPDEMHGI